MPKPPYDASGIDDRDLEASFLRDQKLPSILTAWQQREQEAKRRRRENLQFVIKLFLLWLVVDKITQIIIAYLVAR
ncbi:MAG: hypothetical protein ACOYOL_12470 [Chthoniobacterales bacterium]